MIGLLPCRPGYQAQVSIFLAPTNYTLKDYLSWPDTDAINNEQYAFVRAKLYISIVYTRANLYGAPTATSNATWSSAGTGPRLQQVRGSSKRRWEGEEAG